MITLGIDTSNYATSISVVDNENHKILLFEKIFLPVKTGELGLRQQDAVFNHIKTLTNIFQKNNNFDFSKISAIGVTTKPKNEENSYMPCFLVGKMLAYSISSIKNIPIIELSHQECHIESCLFSLNNKKFDNEKFIMLHISGGTTDIILIEDGKIIKTIGSSNDLYAGQAIDRLGVKLGFSFPAGKYVSDLASEYKKDIKTKVSVNGYNCNLSGLENQCDKMLKEDKDKSYIAKYNLSFIANSLIQILKNVRKDYGDLPIVSAGGVMSSKVIREIMQKELLDIYFCEEYLSGDNAVGAATKSYKRIING